MNLRRIALLYCTNEVSFATCSRKVTVAEFVVVLCTCIEQEVLSPEADLRLRPSMQSHSHLRVTTQCKWPTQDCCDFGVGSQMQTFMLISKLLQWFCKNTSKKVVSGLVSEIEIFCILFIYLHFHCFLPNFFLCSIKKNQFNNSELGIKCCICWQPTPK